MWIEAYRVEGRSIDGFVNMVGTSNRVRSEERDNLEGSKASGVIETLKNLGDIVLGLRNQAFDGSDGLVRATGQELETWSTLETRQVISLISPSGT